MSNSSERPQVSLTLNGRALNRLKHYTETFGTTLERTRGFLYTTILPNDFVRDAYWRTTHLFEANHRGLVVACADLQDGKEVTLKAMIDPASEKPTGYEIKSSNERTWNLTTRGLWGVLNAIFDSVDDRSFEHAQARALEKVLNQKRSVLMKADLSEGLNGFTITGIPELD